jgi:hypothetical protein|tara:strand:- start:2312 stop:2491 length:180 start_codon:yes stop_codon:yes gene_type:complete
VNTRKLKDGTEVQELDKSIQLSILTKCPGKWKIVDMETGQEYVASGDYEMYKQWKEIKN